MLDSTCPGVHAILRRTPDGSDTVLVMLNFGSTQATQCALTASTTGLATGSLDITNLVTGDRAADLAVDEEGAIIDYIPLDTLGAREAAILHPEP